MSGRDSCLGPLSGVGAVGADGAAVPGVVDGAGRAADLERGAGRVGAVAQRRGRGLARDAPADGLGVGGEAGGQASVEHGQLAPPQSGVATGLAWTEVGGELLTIEGLMMPGKGKMTVTGNLRDVMKESISAAASYVRSRAVFLLFASVVYF